MKNNKNIQLLYYLIFIFLFHPMYLFSQEQTDEYKIKGSKEYYWGQAYNADSTLAYLAARDALMLKISSQINKSSDLNAKTDIMVKSIRYLHKPVEDLIKVVAYVPIVNVTNIIENKDPLLIGEVIYTEEKKDSIIESPKESSNSPIERPSEQEQKEIIVKKNNQVAINLPLLDQMIDCNTANELKSIIQREVKKNTIIYNWNSESYRKMASPEPYYIVIIDPKDNKIIAFLDKGKAERKDLKHPSSTINILSEYQNYIQVWLQIF